MRRRSTARPTRPISPISTRRARSAPGTPPRRFPAGTFASEARYNRALCLVRLGRLGEAREALGPFARGDYGNYRHAEAAALLEALPPP